MSILLGLEKLYQAATRSSNYITNAAATQPAAAFFRASARARFLRSVELKDLENFGRGKLPNRILVSLSERSRSL